MSFNQPNTNIKHVTLQFHQTKDIYEGFFYLEKKTREIYGEFVYRNQLLKYIGEFKNNVFHGNGVILHNITNQLIYEGEFKNGRQTGYGKKYNHQLGICIYQGYLKEDKKQGYGVFVHSSGDIYIGQFENDVKNGFGIYIWRDRQRRYEGQWKQDKQYGYGIFYFGKGGYYKGNWENGLKNGYGEQKWASDSVVFYKGNWVNNKKEGKGYFIHKTGDIYKGDFKNDKKHGIGSYQWKNSHRLYNGAWVDDKRNGLGQQKEVNGDFYIGMFVNAKRQGYGTLYYHLPMDKSRIEQKYALNSVRKFTKESCNQYCNIENDCTVNLKQQGYRVAVLDKPLEDGKEFAFSMTKGQFKWVYIGVCDIEKQKDIQYELKDFKQKMQKLDHGFCMISNTGWVMNSFHKDQNLKHISPLKFGKSFTIICKYDQKQQILYFKQSFIAHGKKHIQSFPLKIDPNIKLHPVVVLHNEGDHVSYIDDLNLYKDIQKNNQYNIPKRIGINNLNEQIGIQNQGKPIGIKLNKVIKVQRHQKIIYLQDLFLGHQLVIPQKSTYKGYFHNNQFEGEGIMKNEKGQELHGDWIQGDLVNIKNQNICDLEQFGNIPFTNMKIFNFIEHKTIHKTFKQIKEQATTTKNQDVSEHCAYCYEDYEDEDILAQLNCPIKHFFHKSCLAKFLMVNFFCPFCQTL